MDTMNNMTLRQRIHGILITAGAHDPDGTTERLIGVVAEHVTDERDMPEPPPTKREVFAALLMSGLIKGDLVENAKVKAAEAVAFTDALLTELRGG